ncbi:hypothetical protein LTR84_010632 [Exophiala bonariae]|uniref:Uncharacterized protein n=1 Tax=Exophiala bonariae TaxID=1690606 RepID=A0AAV9MW97_9EURO|nr:hypothetical protein LTR84_010632 [Exophiala bonariae]
MAGQSVSTTPTHGSLSVQHNTTSSTASAAVASPSAPARPLALNTAAPTPRARWWTSARKHVTTDRLSLATAFLGLGLAVYFFVAPYTLAKASLAAAEKANKITLWKDCRDREDLRTSELCQQYLNVTLGSIVKRYASDMWAQVKEANSKPLRDWSSSTTTNNLQFGPVFKLTWLAVNLCALYTRFRSMNWRPEAWHGTAKYVSVSGVIVWFTACLNALTLSGAAALIAQPLGSTVGSAWVARIAILFIKRLFVSLMGWALLRRACWYSGLKIAPEVNYEPPGFPKLNFAILITAAGMSLYMFWILVPLAHTAEWQSMFEWKVSLFLIGAKQTGALFGQWMEDLAMGKGGNHDVESVIQERRERDAREVFSADYDSLYEAVLGVWRVIAGVIWGVDASRRHPPGYLKHIKED